MEPLILATEINLANPLLELKANKNLAIMLAYQHFNKDPFLL